MKKTIKIFVASSIHEFRNERNELGRFILGINNMNLKRGIYCFLELCENHDNSISARERKQDEYNEFIKDADAVFVLFFKKAGKYTVEELRLAKDYFAKNGTPKVYTYFKDFDESKLSGEIKEAYDIICSEYKHFFATFETIQTIEVDILRAMFELFPNDCSEIEENDGIIYLGNQPIMTADELDYIKNNKAIDSLKAKIAGLRSGDSKYTDGLYGDEIDAEIEKSEKLLKERYRKCFKALEARYKSISSAEEHDAELQAAFNASANGDYEKVNKILNLKEIKLSEEKKFKERELNDALFYKTDFKKLTLKINALKETDRREELEEAYSYAIEVIEKWNLYNIDSECLEIWLDFIFFLDNQNKTQKSLPLAKRLDGLCSYRPELINDYYKSYLWNTIANIYYYQNIPDKAEEFYIKAIDIREKLAESNPERFNPDLATSYNNAGIFYKDQGQAQKAEEFYIKAIDILEKLAESNPEKFNSDLAMSYNNAGSFYKDQGQAQKAEEFYIKAIDIREKLAESNPERFNSDLAISYNNAGIIYANQGQAQKAEEFYIKAIDILEKLAESNPEKFNPDLAMSYNNAGVFYKDQGQAQKAEEFYIKAIDIREKLAESNPERFNPDLAGSYNNAGNFYSDHAQPQKAEEFCIKAIDIYKKLAESNPERFNPDLARSYITYAILRNDHSLYEKAYKLALTAPDNPWCRKVINTLKDLFE